MRKSIAADALPERLRTKFPGGPGVAKLVMFGITCSVCLLTAIGQAILCWLCTSKLAASDLLIGTFILGPYGYLGYLAWRHHSRERAAWALLAIALILSAWGLSVFEEHRLKWQRDPLFRKEQSMVILLVPLIQWIVVLVSGRHLKVQRSWERGIAVPTVRENGNSMWSGPSS